MTKLLIFFISLLIPASKPCLNGFSSDGGSYSGLLRGETGIQCLQALPALEPKIKFVNFFLRKPEIAKAIDLIDETKPFLPYLDYFLGRNKPTTYLILLQNNYEMRANGGFFGSYAVVTIGSTTPSSPPPYEGGGWVGVRFQDIYVPDGALPGHVEPPAPIQRSFQQGWFKLRDSDWEPDFPTAATTIRWFFEKGNEVNPDLLITLNLTTIEKIIKVLGEITVPEYDLTLTADNLYALLQNQAEMRAFQGSTQKKDVITAAGRAVLKKLSSLKFAQYLQLAQIIIDQLNRGNLLVNSSDQEVQTLVEEKDWAGKLTTPLCLSTPSVSPPYEGGDQVGVSCLNDTMMLVEANMGANKANCCIDRKTTHTITFSPYEGEVQRGYLSHLINLTFTNNSPLENPAPPRFYGGNYISYLRFYIPENATRIRLTAQPTLPKTLIQYPKPFDGINQKTFDLKDNYGLREVGFFHLTAAGTSSQVQLSYELPLDVSPGDRSDSSGVGFSSDGGRSAAKDSSEVKPYYYQLTLLKQHGLETSPQEINLFGKSSSTNLDSDFSISAQL